MANHISKHTGKQIDDAIDVASTKFSGTLPKAIGGFTENQTISDMSISEVLDNLLFPYVAPSISSISFSPTGSATVAEKGSNISVKTITVSYRKGSKTVDNLSAVLKKNSTDTNLTPSITDSKITFTYAEADSVSAATIYEVTLTDGVENVSISVTAFSFKDPYFYGILADIDGITADEIKAGTKVVRSKANYTAKFTASEAFPYIAYPASYGNLRSIKDPNNFECLSSFDTMTIDIPVLSGTVSYLVYYHKNAASCTDFAYTFNY